MYTIGISVLVIVILLTCALGQNIDLSKSVLKKCVCRENEVESSGGCRQHDSIFVNIVDDEFQIDTDVHINEFSKVVVETLTCPENYYKASIDYDLARISMQGPLVVDPTHQTNLYCLEYYLDDNNILNQRYEVCLRVVPLCCRTNETTDPVTRECVTRPNNVTYGQLWPEEIQYLSENFKTCERTKPTFKDFLLNPDPLTLNMAVGPLSSTSGKTCLYATGYNGNIYYGRKYCECDHVTCISLCCHSLEEVYIEEEGHCEPTNITYNVTNLALPSTERKPVHRMVSCDNHFTLNFSISHSILSDGSLQPEKGLTLEPHHFCLGIVDSENISYVSGISCHMSREEPCSWRFTVIKVFLVISSVFIIATLVVYLGVGKLRNKISGACLISELLALLVSQINLIVIQTSQGQFTEIGCLTAGVIELVFILASFFWLNVMCFDVWSTFRVFRPHNEKGLNKKLFLKYSLYAWGIPLIMGAVVVAVDVMELEPRPSFYLHVYQRAGCFFVSSASSLAAQWLYLYGIILILLCVNCGFFIHVGSILLPHQLEQRKIFKKGTGSVKTRETNMDADNFRLYAKLFVIMGLPWLIEVFTPFTVDAHECYIWVFDLFNMLRGFFIFIIFVFKTSTRDMIVDSWCKKKTPQNGSSSGRSRKTSLMSLSNWWSSRKAFNLRTINPFREDVKETEN